MAFSPTATRPATVTPPAGVTRPAGVTQPVSAWRFQQPTLKTIRAHRPHPAGRAAAGAWPGELRAGGRESPDRTSADYVGDPGSRRRSEGCLTHVMMDGELADLLAAWLPAQRWFAGSGATVRDIAITSDVVLIAGDPELRHLIVAVSLGAGVVSYQVPIGLRRQLPPSLTQAAIGPVADGRMAYDALRDPELTAVLLAGIAGQRTAGQLRFAAESGAVIDPAAAGRTLPARQSNTSIVFGNRAILKVLRRPFEGHHPDLELPGALARSGSRLVAAPLGWIEIDGPDQAGPGQSADVRAPTVLAILSEYIADASDGWSLATASLRAQDPDFSAESRVLGQATAELHAQLAAAFGSRLISHQALTDLADTMTADLERAVIEVPELGMYRADMAACYAEFAEFASPVLAQRIHGDYHLAQVLGNDGSWVVLDFEGEPSVPLAQRRAYAPALRDVAGMLRSFDYVARHQMLERATDQRLQAIALDWATRCSEAFCAGYAQASGADPRASGPLLRALIFAKAVYEAVYEARHRPDWLPIPLSAIAEAAR